MPRSLEKFTKDALGHKRFTSIDKVENNGLDITGHFRSDQWGDFRTYFRFRQDRTTGHRTGEIEGHIMHTIIVLAIGFALLGLCALAGYLVASSSGIAMAALVFLPLWFIGAGINMVMGVKKAGYSVAEETPMFLLVFGVPAVAALTAWWWLR